MPLGQVKKMGEHLSIVLQAKTEKPPQLKEGRKKETTGGSYRSMEKKHTAPDIVYCNKCGMGNPSANKFCYGCGNSLLSLACGYCSQVNPHYAKFCGSCGRKLRATG